jgi:hypothetical protein
MVLSAVFDTFFLAACRAAIALSFAWKELIDASI